MGRLAHNKSMRVTYHHDERVDVAGTGFTVLDRVYADGGFAGEALGGSCGNVLVSLAMLHRHVAPLLALGMDNTGERSEEHTSELQSLMRISYSVFFLKKKTNITE